MFVEAYNIDFSSADTKKAMVLVPEGIAHPIVSSSITTVNYRLTRHENRTTEFPYKQVYLYAPSYLGLWALFHYGIMPHRFCGIIIDESIYLSKLRRLIIKLRLLIEKLRLGSDVPSPFLTSWLNAQRLRAVATNITIGDWLRIFERPAANSEDKAGIFLILPRCQPLHYLLDKSTAFKE